MAQLHDPRFDKDREEIVEFFKAEQKLFYSVPLDHPMDPASLEPNELDRERDKIAEETFGSHFAKYYHPDCLVIHAHHSNSPVSDITRLGTHPLHRLNTLRDYITHNILKVQKFLMMRHSLVWLNIKEDAGKERVALAALVIEGLEVPKNTKYVKTMDENYEPGYCHMGIWVLRKKWNGVDDYGSWVVHLVLSGLEVNKASFSFARKDTAGQIKRATRSRKLTDAKKATLQAGFDSQKVSGSKRAAQSEWRQDFQGKLSGKSVKTWWGEGTDTVDRDDESGYGTGVSFEIEFCDLTDFEGDGRYHHPIPGVDIKGWDIVINRLT